MSPDEVNRSPESRLNDNDRSADNEEYRPREVSPQQADLMPAKVETDMPGTEDLATKDAATRAADESFMQAVIPQPLAPSDAAQDPAPQEPADPNTKSMEELPESSPAIHAIFASGRSATRSLTRSAANR